MSHGALDLLRSEIGMLASFIEELGQDDVIERFGLEHRLRAAEERLAALEGTPQSHPLSIAFRGLPVEGSRSIDATFASKAVRAFVEATDTVTASLVKDDLRDHGRLPDAGGRSLRIVDTAVGSFGFELELPPPAVDEKQEALFPTKDTNPHVEAVTTTMRLLDEDAADDEDAISDLIADIHPRAAAKVHAFANVLAENGATFAVAFNNQQVRLDSSEQVKRVVEALAESDISESEESHVGTLLGVLPESRRFEARMKDGSVVQGKVDRAVADIGAFKELWECEEATLEFRVVRVRTRSRYILAGASTGSEPE